MKGQGVGGQGGEGALSSQLLPAANAGKLPLLNMQMAAQGCKVEEGGGGGGVGGV